MSIKVNVFCNGDNVTLELNNSMTGKELVKSLFPDSPSSFVLLNNKGQVLEQTRSIVDQGIKHGDTIYISTQSCFGGDTSKLGLRKSSTDNFSIEDLQRSSEALIMFINLFDNLSKKYENQKAELEVIKQRSNDRFIATVLLLVSQFVLSIGANLLTSKSSGASTVLIVGIVITFLALYLTFRRSSK